MHRYAHWAEGRNIAASPPWTRAGSVHPPLGESGRAGLYRAAQAQAHIPIAPPIPPAQDQPRRRDPALYQGHMTSSLSLVIDFVHWWPRGGIFRQDQALMYIFGHWATGADSRRQRVVIRDFQDQQER